MAAKKPSWQPVENNRSWMDSECRPWIYQRNTALKWSANYFASNFEQTIQAEDRHGIELCSLDTVFYQTLVGQCWPLTNNPCNPCDRTVYRGSVQKRFCCQEATGPCHFRRWWFEITSRILCTKTGINWTMKRKTLQEVYNVTDCYRVFGGFEGNV